MKLAFLISLATTALKAITRATKTKIDDLILRLFIAVRAGDMLTVKSVLWELVEEYLLGDGGENVKQMIFYLVNRFMSKEDVDKLKEEAEKEPEIQVRGGGAGNIWPPRG
jgi:hypothetical protein